MSARLTRILTRLAVTLLVTVAVAVPVAYLAAPMIQRKVHLNWITSADAHRRMQGLQYVAAHAGSDVRVFEAVVGKMGDVDDTTFQLVVDALQAAQCWKQTDVPDDIWLRWITLHAREPGIEAPSRAAQHLAKLQDLADDPRLTDLLAELTGHSEPDVRYNALCSVAELFQSAEIKLPYYKMIKDCIGDPEPVIAEHAGLIAYLVGIPDVSGLLVDDISQDVEAERFGQPEIEALLFSLESALQAVGCVLAVRDLDEEAVERLITELLSAEDSQARKAGAMLVGLSGQQVELLKEKLIEQTDWGTATVMRLGLWMQDEVASDEIHPEALLAHGDVPRTTIILSLLQRQNPMAWEVLLNPLGAMPADLANLIEDYGWSHVLDYYLPKNAPRWRNTDDAEFQQLQIDMLRDWYLVNRNRLQHLEKSD